MTLAEQWFSQGEAKGEAKGHVQALTKMLTKLLRSKFGELPESALSRLTSASMSELEMWIERVLSATTLEQVLDEPNP